MGGSASPHGCWKGDIWSKPSDDPGDTFPDWDPPIGLLLREGREVRRRVQEEFAPLVNITGDDLKFTMMGGWDGFRLYPEGW